MNLIPKQSGPVDLAHEPDFRLGDLAVRPSACRVRIAGRDRRLEPRVMEVLVTLARAQGRTVTREELIESCWGGRFVSDDAISRVIAQVRNLARSVDPAPFVLETLPKVGFRLVIPSAQTSDAAPEAPAPDVKQTATPRPPGAGFLQAARRRPLMAAAIALVLAIAAGAAWLAPQWARPAGHNSRVQVMEFEPLQPNDPALRRYSVALADAVIRILASNGVETSGRPARRDAGGRRTGAEFRVAGTIDRDGPKYVINAQVLDRRSGDVLWSGRFDRDANAPVGFQEEAANRIADGLDCALWHRTAGRRAMTTEVFSLFLNACVDSREAETTLEARPFVEVAGRLVQAAPDYSYAHSIHAVALAYAASDVRNRPSEAESQSRAVEAASQRALRLDRRNGEAYMALGIRHSWGRGSWLEREQNFARAAELSPSLRAARHYYVYTLMEAGRWEEAEAMNRRTIADDPFSADQLFALALLVGAAGDLAEAEALSKRLDLLDPDVARQVRYLTIFWREAPDRARTQLRRYADPNDRTGLACNEAYLGRLARAGDSPLRGVPPECATWHHWRVRMLARQGDVDGAYAWLAADPSYGSASNTLFLFDPSMKAFRRDPRFMPLAHRLGLVDYWMKSGRWPDFCAEPDLPYDCKAVANALTTAAPGR